ncbi:hypothetical protein GCM10009850_105800 [Nonomuraea monospora]|uniref:Antitoxin Xre/MbcA/ParS-like toxin-binding domain-containing protein n=1 Tax=Nonomuraea monospora TaxID=568818 RepID=A0ABN3D011_9ACTN
MQVTVAQVIGAFLGWQVYDLAGGWAAVRTNLLPRASGLSNVRCGETLEELVRHLESETRHRP